MRQIPYGAEVRIQLKFLAEGNVDAGKPTPDGSSHWSFKAHVRALDGFNHFFRNVFAVLLESIRTHLERLPLEFHACSLENAHRGLGYFWPDAIPRYQRYLMAHGLKPVASG